MRLVARGAAKLMAADDGPRIGALAFDGWDTHANEGGPVGRLAQLLGGLDGALAEFQSGLGARWRDTVIVVATEFGRTARINGTEGTDHGTGTIALLAGGVLLHQFATSLDPRIVVTVLSVVLGVVAAVLSLLSYTRWRANEIAIRHGRPLPFSWILPVLAAVCLVVSAVLTVLLIVT